MASSSNLVSERVVRGIRKRRKFGIKYKGVYACRESGRRLWQAQISISGNTHHLGVFSSPEEAARAYDAKAKLLGRRQNFQDSPWDFSMAATTMVGVPMVPAHLADDMVSDGFGACPARVNDLDDEKISAFWRGTGVVLPAATLSGPSGGAPSGACSVPLFPLLPTVGHNADTATAPPLNTTPSRFCDAARASNGVHGAGTESSAVSDDKAD